MQEWLNSVMTTNWLLGFSMGIATKAFLNGIENVTEQFIREKTDDDRPVDDRPTDAGDPYPPSGRRREP